MESSSRVRKSKSVVDLHNRYIAREDSMAAKPDIIKECHSTTEEEELELQTKSSRKHHKKKKAMLKEQQMKSRSMFNLHQVAATPDNASTNSSNTSLSTGKAKKKGLMKTIGKLLPTGISDGERERKEEKRRRKLSMPQLVAHSVADLTSNRSPSIERRSWADDAESLHMQKEPLEERLLPERDNVAGRDDEINIAFSLFRGYTLCEHDTLRVSCVYCCCTICRTLLQIYKRYVAMISLASSSLLK